MANINLLPWREELRQERNKVTAVMCAAVIGAALLVVFGAKLIMDARISHQSDRNAFIQAEINKLSAVIKEIEDIKQRRDALSARIDVIQSLQQNRAKIVHIFDDLVNKLPDGVFYDSVQKSGTSLSIKGKAQSNERVSRLMTSLDDSEWFDNSSLKVVDVLAQNGISVSEFDIEVKEQQKSSGNDGTETVR